jgi:hypothetical protein
MLHYIVYNSFVLCHLISSIFKIECDEYERVHKVRVLRIYMCKLKFNMFKLKSHYKPKVEDTVTR